MNRIDVYELVKSGFKTIEFDPSKVKLKTNDTFIPRIDAALAGNIAHRKVCYIYDCDESPRVMWDANYSMRWGDTKVFLHKGFRGGMDMFSVVKVETPLRKRPNKNQWSKSTLAKHEDRASTLDKYTLSWAIEEFKTAFEDFNKWYKEEQTKEVVERFGKVSVWDFKEDSSIVEYDAQIKSLEGTIKALREERFKEKTRLVVNCIVNDSENISDDFKEPLLAKIEEEKSKGYVDRFVF